MVYDVLVFRCQYILASVQIPSPDNLWARNTIIQALSTIDVQTTNTSLESTKGVYCYFMYLINLGGDKNSIDF